MSLLNHSHKGRPPPPATKGMSEEEAKEAIDKWRKDWESQRDKNCCNNCKCASVEGCSYVEGTIVYTGCTLDQLRTMESVLQAPLLQGHTFPDKDTLHMRIVEEANPYGIFIKSVRSDPFQLNVVGCCGDPFHVYATYGMREQQ